MSTYSIHETGKKAERTASNYLISKGYEIISANYHSRYGEIDIIAIKENCLVFFEVKGSISISDKLMFDRVTLKKQQKIILTAQDYLSKNIIEVESMRFDVLLMSEDKHQEWHIEHIENAFTL